MFKGRQASGIAIQTGAESFHRACFVIKALCRNSVTCQIAHSCLSSDGALARARRSQPGGAPIKAPSCSPVSNTFAEISP